LLSLLMLFVILSPTESTANPATLAEAVIAPNGRDPVDLSSRIEIFVDSSRKLTIADISQPAFATRFTQPERNPRNLGLLTDPIWVRITIMQRADDAGRKVIESGYVHADNIELYRPRGDGSFDVSAAGDQTLVSSRELPDRLMLLPTKQSPGTTVTYFLRYQDSAVASLVFELWDAESLNQQRTIQMALFGAFYGALAILFVYSIALYLAGRIRVYLTYAVYLFVLVFFMAAQNGFTGYLLWPSSPALTNPALPTAIFLGSIGVMWFTRHFLDTQRLALRLDRALAVFQWCGASLLVVFVLAPVSALAWLSIGFGLCASCMGYGAGIYSAFVRQQRAGWFHFIAFSLTFVGAMILGARAFGWMNISVLTEYGMQVGILFEMLVFAVGLADRVAMLRREKERAHSASLTDSLTGLSNRAGLMVELPASLSRAARTGTTVAVLMMDLDGFKPINDQFGHDVGDEFLRTLGLRLKTHLRAHDTVARLGGDEFVVTVEGLAEAADVQAMAEKIRENLAQPVSIHRRTGKPVKLEVSSSIGVAMWDGQTNQHAASADHDISALLRSADLAMYAAKRAGKNRVQFAEAG
jgi:two-component system, sensor histidine kinase LadS